MPITLTDVTAILGATFGTGGLVLGILNYLRDRPVVKVLLQWNMEMIGGDVREGESECGVVTVTNAGRRPVYISHVCLILPKHHQNRLLLVMNSVPGRRLSEGDPPVQFIIPAGRCRRAIQSRSRLLQRPRHLEECDGSREVVSSGSCTRSRRRQIQSWHLLSLRRGRGERRG